MGLREFSGVLQLKNRDFQGHISKLGIFRDIFMYRKNNPNDHEVDLGQKEEKVQQ